MTDLLTGKPWAQAPWELVVAPISAQAFRVVMAIQLHRRPDGEAPFPSQRRLADMCGVSVPTIKRSIDELKEAGILTTVQRTRAGGQASTNAHTLRLPHQGSSVIPGPGITGDPAEVDFSVGSSKQTSETASPEGSQVAARVRTPRDEIWDTLVEVTGIEPATKGERSRFGRSVSELLDVLATPEEVRARARRWPMKYKGATLTDRALVNRWGELASSRGGGERGMSPDDIRKMGKT